LTTCNNFLTGLNEFLKGLKKLRREQRNRISHLDQVIEELHNQRAAVAEKIWDSEKEAIEKLKHVRHQLIAPAKGPSSAQQHLVLLDEENEFKTHGSPLPMEDIVRKRVNRMNQVYTKLRDLESRAMTTDSREYLRGLTEIRQLQVIMNDPHLKYFFSVFVGKTNQIFHDFQLASIAIQQQTATVEDPGILGLTGIKMLLSILKRNKRTIHLAQDIEEMMRFVQAIPDREIVVMH